MVLIARPAWASQTKTLGIAYLRRTWCHHLFLEFFAAHPHVIAKWYEKIDGVGDAILHQIVGLAEQLNIRCIWGEATEISSSWYQDHLAIKEVGDHFFIEDDVMEHCQRERHSKSYVTFMRSQKSNGIGVRKVVQPRRKLVAA